MQKASLARGLGAIWPSVDLCPWELALLVTRYTCQPANTSPPYQPGGKICYTTTVMQTSPAALGRKLGVTRQRAHQILNAEKDNSRTLLRRAVQRGDLAKPDTCSRCGGGGRIEGHHTDYAKPLDVQWLCPPCHFNIHPHFANGGARLRWDCPGCGTVIDIQASGIWKRLAAHCRSCARKRCGFGHLKTKSGYCECQRARANRIVRYRTCRDCETVIPVTANNENVAQVKGFKLERCSPCQAKRASKARWQR